MFSKIANKDLLNLYVSDEEICEFVMGEEIYDGMKISSVLPFRDDGDPSMSFTYTSSGNLMWKDFGFPEQEKFDSIALATYMMFGDEAVDDHERCRIKACNSLWNKLVINREKEFRDIDRKTKEIKSFRGSSYMDFELKEWDKESLSYWKDYGITKKTLEKFNVRPIESLYVYDKPMWEYRNSEPMYLYTFSERLNKYKVYRPHSDPGSKFRSQNIYSVVEGFGKLPADDMEEVFVLSSLKDTMAMYEAGFYGCNPTTEAAVKVMVNLIKTNLIKRAKRVILFLDNDEQGVKSTKEVLKKMGTANVLGIYIPQKFKDEGIKDPSDFANKYGIQKLRKLVKILTKKKIDYVNKEN